MAKKEKETISSAEFRAIWRFLDETSKEEGGPGVNQEDIGDWIDRSRQQVNTYANQKETKIPYLVSEVMKLRLKQAIGRNDKRKERYEEILAEAKNEVTD